MSAALLGGLGQGVGSGINFGMGTQNGTSSTSYNNNTQQSGTYQGQGTQTNQVQALTPEEQALSQQLAQMSGSQYGNPAYMNALKQLGSLVNGGMQASPAQLKNLHNIMQNSVSATQNALNYNMTNPSGTLNNIVQTLNSKGMTNSSIAPWMMGGALQQENSALSQAADAAASNYETAAVNTPYQTAGTLTGVAGLGQGQQALNAGTGSNLFNSLYGGNLANKTTTNNTSGSQNTNTTSTGSQTTKTSGSNMSFGL